tara:strand:- start:1743 stop:2369 length:627 start_codon:yes stop_codon:yes gene_type:complete
MARKCPPGVFCIENTTIVFLIIIIALFFFVMTKTVNKISLIDNNYLLKYLEHPFRDKFHFNILPKLGARASNHPGDILSNPYLPPHRDGHYFPKDSGDPRGIPINIPTQGPRTQWKQVGILTRLNGEETILPLMGRPLYSNRQKWQFYTLSDKNNSVKLPISKNGKSCTGNYGCDELFNGDSVFVEGYNDAFKATIYENNTPEYIPYI